MMVAVDALRVVIDEMPDCGWFGPNPSTPVPLHV